MCMHMHPQNYCYLYVRVVSLKETLSNPKQTLNQP